jgi:hypothetical protein
MQAFLESDEVHNLPEDRLDELLTVLERVIADYQNLQIEIERRTRAYWDRRWAQLRELERELDEILEGGRTETSNGSSEDSREEASNSSSEDDQE